MNIKLAGATLDRRFWKDDEAATPEVTAAAYARVSHSPRSLKELRDNAVEEVEKARSSNERIVYRMGHSSIAEHAVFNIDIEDASRLLVEFIERHRLASFTERSQRYVFFEGKEPIVPAEIGGTPIEKKLAALDREKFDLYKKLESDPDLKEKYGDRLLEQARYVLGLTCPTDIGMTVNARELEHIISKGLGSGLAEIREFSEKLLLESGDLAPSLVKYTDPGDFRGRAEEEIRKFIDEVIEPRWERSVPEEIYVRVKRRPVCHGIPSVCDDPESEIAAALIFQYSNIPFPECRDIAMEMSDEELIELLLPIFRHYPPHASLHRSFELMDLTFDFEISASGFAQLKRHRMATIISQDYMHDRWEIPELMLHTADLTTEYLDLLKRSSELYQEIEKELGAEVAAYALTNAHRRRVLLKLNLRELYHFVRLRSDGHAQDEIRGISDRIVKEMKKHYPVVTALLCGKDMYSETHERILGCDE
ncbi:MAG: FAD-dependent thymidylate synthase [Thermoplasmatota archaeon]